MGCGWLYAGPLLAEVLSLCLRSLSQGGRAKGRGELAECFLGATEGEELLIDSARRNEGEPRDGKASAGQGQTDAVGPRRPCA